MKKVKFIFVLALFCLLIIPQAIMATTEINASEFQTKILGENSFSSAGVGVAAGDFNGDGLQDLLIGAPDEDLDEGIDNISAVYIIYGSTVIPGELDLSSADAKFIEEEAQDRIGRDSLASGDFNNDGFDDILIGATQDDDGGSGAGAVYLIYGSATAFSGTINLADADVKFIGQYSEDQGMGDSAGSSLANGGDINNDGIDDILIGARHYSDTEESKGAVYVIYGDTSLSGSIDLGTADVQLIGEDAVDNAGNSVAGGDVNGDGYSDLLIAAYFQAEGEGNDHPGSVYIVYGSDDLDSSISLADADVKMSGDTDSFTAGRAVAVGNINSDDYADIIVGSNPGVSIIYGSAALGSSFYLTDTDIYIERSATSFGLRFSVNLADFNNDGLGDIIIGDEDSGTSNTGEVFVFFNESISSGLDMDDADLKIVGENIWDRLGSSGYPVGGDFNGDGFDDILLGAYGEDTGGEDAGAAYIGYVYLDSDGDSVAGDLGLVAGTDCDDTDATVSENQTYYLDSDGNGYGDPAETTSVCSSTAPDGYAATALLEVPENTANSSSGVYTATLGWDEVVDAESYNIRYRKATASGYTTATATTNSAELTGLMNAGKYYWQVQSVSGDYTSEWTTEKRLVTYPRKVKKSEFTFPKNKRQAHQVRIKIETMATRITGFNVLVYKGNKKIKTLKVVNKSAKKYVYSYIKGLKAGTKYKFEVKARRTIGATKYLSQNVAKKYITTLEE